MRLKFLCLLLTVSMVLTMVPSVNAATKASSTLDDGQYLIGAGMYDITGPAAELIMEGYAKSDQIASGIRQRLRSRAFIVQDSAGSSAVFVSADIALMFGGIKEGIIKKLAENGYGNKYTAENVMLSSIHTHASLSVCSYYAMYNISAKGFNRQNYNAIVNGIYMSIVNAHNNLEPGYIEINQGELEGVSVNRSKVPCNNNPEEERNRYSSDVDKTMTLLNFRASDGTLLGVVNWFALHSTSMNHHNSLVCGDNKGYASYLFEKDMGSDYLNNSTFVAAFAQSNAGDVSPNINYETLGNENGYYGLDDLKNTEYEGENQYLKAKELSSTATVRLTGSVDCRHTNVDMQNVIISEEYNMQHYEGASTLYGKWILDAYRQEFNKLAQALADGAAVAEGPSTRDLSDDQVTFVTEVVLDNVPLGKKFGDVVTNTASSYNRGDTASATFWGGHPKNDLKTQSSYLEIQRKTGSTWITVYYDWDWCTTFNWTRISTLLGTSQVTITWDIPEDAPSGTYRIKYNGADKSGWTGKIRQHTGYSWEFTVE